MSDDPYLLERFLSAQRDSYEVALQELISGTKRSHWMWFIFPQVAGLGSSAMAVRYAIKSRQEAEAYLSHPILGPRLMKCTEAILQISGKSAKEIMGEPDDLKLKSSMTLFASISVVGSAFHVVLERYFAGEGDSRTNSFLMEHA